MRKEFQLRKSRTTTCLGKLEIQAGLDQKLPDNTNLPWFQPIGDISRVGAKAASRSKATLTPTIQATSKPSLVLSGTEMAVVDLRSYLLVLFWTSLMVVYAKFEPSPSCLPPSFSLGTWKQITPAHTCSWLDICKSFWSSCYSMAAVQCPVSTSKTLHDCMMKSAIWYLLAESENGQVEMPLPEVRPLGATLGAQVTLADTLCNLLSDVKVEVKQSRSCTSICPKS